MTGESPRVAMLSLWRNDADRQLTKRAYSLLRKFSVTRWVWVVGNSTDDTEAQLRDIQRTSMLDITILVHNSDVTGNAPDERLRRLSETANAAYDTVRPDDDYWVSHESDLVSSVRVVDHLLELRKPVVAGWVTLGKGGVFYDTYAYRKNGRKFINDPPYHPEISLDAPFQVDSAGSVLLYPSQPLREGARMHTGGLVEMCDQFRARGLEIWVDPSISIVQPVDLWTSAGHPTY